MARILSTALTVGTAETMGRERGAAARAGPGAAVVATGAPADRNGPGLAAAGGATDGAGSATGPAAAGAAAGAAGAGVAAATAAGVGILIVGAAVGFGGKLIRTVSFFGWTFPDSDGFVGVAPPGRFGVFSGIIHL